MDITKSNINNLAHLWKTASSSFQTYFEQEEYSYCFIPNSQWPNRIWTNSKINNNILQKIADEIETNDNEIIFSFFNANSLLNAELINGLPFTEKSVQYGMSMVLGNKYNLNNRLIFAKVESNQEILEWCNAFESSFNYKISKETLQNNVHKTDFYLIYFNGNIAGTIMLHLTDDIAGIHSLGIIPEMRAKGIARDAMKKILNISIDRKARYAVLQASEMAKKMYESMGFTTQFTMHNYQLNTK